MVNDARHLRSVSRIQNIEDRQTGLVGVIVIHSKTLGPAAGGCRFWRYPDLSSLTSDAVRLAEGMAYKNALAGLPLGGGKAVLQMPSGPFDRHALFRSFGRAVEKLGGDYVTAEDVGTTPADMAAVATETVHVAGLPVARGQVGGDPSPHTALGVFRSIETAAYRTFGSHLKGLTVAVQGVGHVGAELCKLLHGAGSRLIVTDHDTERARAIARVTGADIVNPQKILTAGVDILAPCALGGVLNKSSLSGLRAKIICGGANNQLEHAEIGDLLHDRGILYCPDYVVNAGGIINVAAEYFGWNADVVAERVAKTGTRLERLLDRADAEKIPPHRMADRMAREVISAVKETEAT